jgi:hypothetical protein
MVDDASAAAGRRGLERARHSFNQRRMMMRRIVTLLVTLGMLGVMWVGPAAADPPPKLDDLDWDQRMWVLCDDVEPDWPPECIGEYPAGEPFFVLHGANMPHGQDFNMKGIAPAVGHFEFKLYLDGVELEPDRAFHGWTMTLNLFMFPDGLSGQHELRGDWYGTCTFEDIGVQEGCEKPSDTWMFFSNTLNINFS